VELALQIIIKTDWTNQSNIQNAYAKQRHNSILFRWSFLAQEHETKTAEPSKMLIVQCTKVEWICNLCGTLLWNHYKAD